MSILTNNLHSRSTTTQSYSPLSQDPNEKNFWVSKEKILGERDEVPYFMVEGTHHHIRTGFRLYFTISDALVSFFTLHNETLNVWTHVIPIPYIIWKSHNMLQTELKDANTTDVFCFLLFTFATIFAFSMSATFHLLRCVSLTFNNVLLKFDISGILMMISSCYVPALAFAFGCKDYNYFLLYSCFIYVLGLISAGVILTRSKFDKDFLQVAPPVAMVLVSIIPIVHFHSTHSDDPIVFEFYFALLSSLACYGIGLGFYILNAPERFLRPGLCDYFFHSHIFWHTFVVFGALRHYEVLSVLYSWKSSQECDT